MAKFDLKPWTLCEEETFSSFSHWKNHIILCLNQKDNFQSLVTATWKKEKEKKQHRDLKPLKDIKDNVIVEAKERAIQLELMLQLIARYAPPYLATDIVQNTTCLDDVWNVIRNYYGLQKSEANFMTFLTIQREPGERPQRLLKRMLALVEDNLLSKDCPLLFQGEQSVENEVMSPTVHRLVTLLWLQKIHPGLPGLIQTKMAYDLQKMTLADLSDQICRNLDLFLQELDNQAAADTVDVSYTSSSSRFSSRQPPRYNNKPQSQSRPFQRGPPIRESRVDPAPVCRVCKAEGRPHRHSMGNCDYICTADKRAMARVYSSTVADGQDQNLQAEWAEPLEHLDYLQDNLPGENPVVTTAVTVRPSPKILAYYNDQAVVITCDTGATSSLLNHQTAIRLGVPIKPSTQSAFQADKSQLEVMGESTFVMRVGTLKLHCSALVVKSLNCQFLAGIPFLENNHVVLDIPRGHLVVAKKHVIKTLTSEDVATKAYLVKAQNDTILLPGGSLNISVPSDAVPKSELALEPVTMFDPVWPLPEIFSTRDGQVSVTNHTDSVISINRGQPVATIRSTFEPRQHETNETTRQPNEPIQINTAEVISSIEIDPDHQWNSDVKSKFENLNHSFSMVFDKSIGKYNDAKGHIRAHINMGAQPPKCKSALPSYSADKLSMMQQKMDDLESEGVLAKPEDLGIVVEQVSPSFLVPKRTPGEYRLVTSFNRLANFVKPPPSRSSSTDDVMIFLARWSHIVKTDMSNQFYQLPLDSRSMKYVGTITPFKGIRIYTRAAMGMPGSSENLDELMGRVIGELMHEGCVTKIADDIYVGGNSASELLDNWRRLLEALKISNLRLSPSKTVINPGKTVVLGWNWNHGELSPSQHKISSLSVADLPLTTKGLRSWMGSVKHLKPCISNYGELFAGFDKLTAGKESHEKIEWDEELKNSFYTAQSALHDVKSFHVPKPSDQLIITTDGAVKSRGIGAVLYIQRGNKRLLGGYFSATLPEYQSRWLPCEVEGIAICAAVRHWSKLIRQSQHRVQVLSDSKPCVEAYNRLSKGQFSSRARICAFLSSLADSRAILSHIAGKSNLAADYQSRQPATCDWENCQICLFIKEESVIVDTVTTVTEVLEGKRPAPFLSPGAWRECQTECQHLRKVYSHLRYGTRPTRKSREPTEVKRYLQHSTIRNGLIVVNRTQPFSPPTDLIVVPDFVVRGLLTALHLRLNHPSSHQLKKVFDRHFFALNAQNHISEVTNHCHTCASLRTLPSEVPEFSTAKPVEHPGTEFSADVLRRKGQFIFVLRDNFSSFTSAEIVLSEKHDDLRRAIVKTVLPLMMTDKAVVRVDNASGLKVLKLDRELAQHGITLEFGDPRNVNKNPIGEKAIQELEKELVRIHPRGERISDVDIPVVLKTLNNRIRSRGLTAQEILFKRELNTGNPLSVDDKNLADEQFKIRVKNHEISARCKVPVGQPRSEYHPVPGDLVYVKTEGDKHCSREPYVVISCFDNHVSARKLCGSQFRSNLTDLLRHQIYPVPHSVHIDNDISSDSDSDANDSPYEYDNDDSYGDHSLEIPPTPGSKERDVSLKNIVEKDAISETEKVKDDDHERQLQFGNLPENDESMLNPATGEAGVSRSGRRIMENKDPNFVYYK